MVLRAEEGPKTPDRLLDSLVEDIRASAEQAKRTAEAAEAAHAATTHTAANQAALALKAPAQSWPHPRDTNSGRGDSGSGDLRQLRRRQSRRKRQSSTSTHSSPEFTRTEDRAPAKAGRAPDCDTASVCSADTYADIHTDTYAGTRTGEAGQYGNSHSGRGQRRRDPTHVTGPHRGRPGCRGCQRHGGGHQGHGEQRFRHDRRGRCFEEQERQELEEIPNSVARRSPRSSFPVTSQDEDRRIGEGGGVSRHQYLTR